VGTAVSLVFGAVAGNFVPRFLLPQWLQYAGFISPNAWGLEAFTRLLAGEGWGAVLVPVAALLAMAVVLFLAAVAAFRRQYAEGE
jgi:ABC-2 type transport system permease protein